MNIRNNYLTRIGLYRKYIEELGPFDPYLAQMGYKETHDVAMYYIETPGVEWVDIKDVSAKNLFPRAIRDNIQSMVGHGETLYIGSEREK